MKDIGDLTYYELLNVPLDASSIEINRAYRKAKAMYGDDALETYALFTNQEKTAILETIETAFSTLIDKKKKAAYDNCLTNHEKNHAKITRYRQTRLKIDEFNENIRFQKIEVLKTLEAVENDDKVKELADKIQSKEIIDGKDLKKMRQALSLDLFDIYSVTKISVTVLKNIENNCVEDLPSGVVLKSFLKWYAEMLRLNPEKVIDGYLKMIS